ncbi:MAG: PD40 domain-containing protein [Rhodopirellula sp.]|nr:PD40 domain-containing protein [Rhodopirellula sp.]
MRSLYALKVPDADEVRDPDVPLWQQYSRLRLKQFELTATGEDGDDVAPIAKSIGESRQGTTSHGELGLWTDKVGRPVAIGTVIVLGSLDSTSMREVNEFHSLHTGEITMTDDGLGKWDVVVPGLDWQPLSDAPAPAKTEAELYAQAMTLAQRFAVETGARGNIGLTLQKAPLHRFAYKSDEQLRGGILIPWSLDTDPEFLLALEVRPDSNGALKWHFAGANYSASGQFLLLDDRLVWSESPARFGPKIQHLGWITGNLNLEDGLTRVIPAEIKEVTVPSPPFRHLGSPEWSTDGKSVVIDISDGGTNTSHVMLLNADGSDPRDLGPGCMPSLSPDEKQVVFSVPGQGILTMNADGSERTVLERRGWGSQWSPDGRFIAYGAGRNIVLADPKTDERRNLLTDEQASGLSYIYWNFGWSQDSQWIVFKLRNRKGEESLAIASIDSPNHFKVVHTASSEINADFTWHPDGKRILFAARDPAIKRYRLYTVNRDNDDPPTPVPGQPRDWQFYDCDWSPDGQHIICSGTAPPKLTEWPLSVLRLERP